MKEQEFIDAMNAIEMDKAAEDGIVHNCLKSMPGRNVTRRPIWIATAACALIFTVMLMGIPYLNHNFSTGKTEVQWLNALTIQAHAKGFGTAKLEKDLLTQIPPGDCFAYHTEERDGRQVKIISGMLAPDFKVEGEKIQSVTYSAENGTLFCEFESNDHDKNGDFLWSASFAIASLDTYGSYVQDLNNPTQQELVEILEVLHTKGELEAFYNTIYTAELREMEGKSGAAWIEARKAFEAKCREPVNFHSFSLSAKRDYTSGGQEILEISIVNPKHPPVAPIAAQSITASSGDTVSWYIPNDSYLAQKIFGQAAEDVDYSKIHDEIHVVVAFESGDTKECVISLRYSSEGGLSLALREV